MSKICVLLLVPVFLLSGLLPALAIQSSDFDDPSVCKGCHAEIYEQWNGTLHSIAYTDPIYLGEEAMASEDTDGLTDAYCSRCHTPIGVLSGEVPPIGLDNPALSEISKKGISCDFCHSVNASTGIGNGAFMVSVDGDKRGPFDDSKSPYHGSVYSELHTKSEFCGMCHDVLHPVNGIAIEETYTEWKEGPYNTGDPETTTYCQDCHMTPGITHFEKNPGKASSIGPDREHIYTHYFVGGSTVIGSNQDMAEARLKAAAKLELELTENGDEVNALVTVTNIGAGHKIPTGLTEAREVWLEIIATDSEGKKIFHAGGLDEDDIIVEDDTTVFRVVLGDSDGEPTMKVWKAEATLSDNRIPPKGTSSEEYIFMLPDGATHPITVKAKLNYRSASPELLDPLFGKGVIVAPVIEMAVVTGMVGESEAEETATPGFGIVSILISLIVGLHLLRIRRV
ncbi:MAG: putative cytochrome c [Candidatus Syntrophoarchaeum sp. GoM_oil]|nr:MAG: putative cytochrome c [Candidatus Syntrophoarchaeum sp. GoM_oil]